MFYANLTGKSLLVCRPGQIKNLTGLFVCRKVLKIDNENDRGCFSFQDDHHATGKINGKKKINKEMSKEE